MNLDFVIVIVKCCIPETNEANLKRIVATTVKKIATVGLGGQQATFSTLFYHKKLNIVLILKTSFYKSEV